MENANVATCQPRISAAHDGEILNVLGESVRIILSGADTGGTLAVVEDVSPPGGGPPLHVHTREDESFVVLEGTVEFTVGESKRTLTPGEFAYVPKGIPHRFQNVGDTPSKLMVTLTPAGFEETFFKPVSEKIGVNPPNMDVLLQLAANSGMQIFL